VVDPPIIHHHELEVPRTARIAALGNPLATEAWLALHGYGQLAGRFLRDFAAAGGPGRIILAPEALSRFYTSREPSRVGATWMTREARESEIRDYLRYLDLVLQEFAPHASTLQVHGFSQGTATATRWLDHAERPVDRVVLWGGGIAPEVDLAALRSRRPAMTWHICVGDADEFITEDAISAETDRLDRAGIPFVLHRFSGGHVVDADTLAALDVPR